MLRILLTNSHLVQPGGSETWTLTVATELVRRGHDVVVYVRDIGPFAENFPCPVVGMILGEYDLGLVNHNSCLPAARPACETVIMTCHGTYPPLEQPVPGADRYVAVSEEVRAHLAQLGYDAAIIRNPIDCSMFAPAQPVGVKVRNVLSLCQGTLASDLLADACAHKGFGLRTIDDDHRELGIERLMNDADLVVGLGRSAMEAMACGRAVLVFDSRSYTPHTMDGLVTPENAHALLECNLSGRRLQLEADIESVSAQLDGYDADLGDFGRAFALEHFEVGRQLDAYLELAAAARVSPRP